MLESGILNLESSLGAIVESAIAISGADFGNIQLVDEKTSELKIVAHRGFSKEWLEFWKSVPAGVGACGTAFMRRERVIVEDVEKSPIVMSSEGLEIHRRARVRAVQSTPLFSRAGKVLGVFSTHYQKPSCPDERMLLLLDLLSRHASDIVERAFAEKALRESEERLRRVSDNASVGLTRLNRDWVYQSCNPAYARIAGKPIEQIVGRPMIEVLGPDGVETVRPHVERVLRGEPVTYETHVPFLGAGLRLLHVSYTPDFDTSGEILGWVACIVDVSDIAALRRIQNELRAALEARDDFISIASHELKTPLSALHLQLDLIKRLLSNSNLDPSSKIHTLASSAYQSAQSLASLVDDLLDVTKIRVGKLSLELKEMDLREAVWKNVELAQESATRRGSTLSVQVGEPVRGYWDPKRIDQILTNLLSNAIKYGESKPIEIRLSLDAGTRMAQIEVQDHGIGISTEMQTKVFERFQRAVDSRTFAGLGLGLYIVRQIVEAHRGSIHLKSEINQGSVFTVLLPINLAELKSG